MQINAGTKQNIAPRTNGNFLVEFDTGFAHKIVWKLASDFTSICQEKSGEDFLLCLQEKIACKHTATLTGQNDIKLPTYLSQNSSYTKTNVTSPTRVRDII